MKILHLSASDSGGAGTAAFRFHRNMTARGINSKMLVFLKQTNDPNVIPLAKPGALSRASRLASKVLLKIRSNPDYYFQDQIKSALNSGIDYFDEIDYQPDIIVAHWISSFVSLEDLYQMCAGDLYQMCAGRNVPVIWYLMDMAPLTGGCHYAWDCVGYMNKCGECPALYSSNSRDMSSKNWSKKYASIQKMNITLVAGSWLINQAEKASLFKGKRKEKIMLGVDADIFKPGSRTGARKTLNLPANKKVLFVGSLSMKQRRKGMRYFLEAVRILEKNEEIDKDNIIILTAGDDSVKKTLSGTVFEHVHTGFLDEGGLVNAYQAADVFVCPSIEDAGPMMTKESIMCGTPVVAFNMGVAGDLVHTGVTGYRAKLMDSNDLADGITQVISLDLTGARKMSSNCRDIGIKLSSEEVQVSAFISLAKEILTDTVKPGIQA
jgi:glycosyltransferase involved in cell wall biosynthesis